MEGPMYLTTANRVGTLCYNLELELFDLTSVFPFNSLDWNKVMCLWNEMESFDMTIDQQVPSKHYYCPFIK